MFTIVSGLSAIGILIAEGLLFWPWPGVIIGVIVAGGAGVVLPSLYYSFRNPAEGPVDG